LQEIRSQHFIDIHIEHYEYRINISIVELFAVGGRDSGDIDEETEGNRNEDKAVEETMMLIYLLLIKTHS
jgi:hypothetical protein